MDGSGAFALVTHRLNCKGRLTNFLNACSGMVHAGVAIATPIDVGLQSASVRADGL